MYDCLFFIISLLVAKTLKNSLIPHFLSKNLITECTHLLLNNERIPDPFSIKKLSLKYHGLFFFFIH